MDDLRAAATWEFFVPANLNGAVNISQITSVDQWRGYPRDRWGNQERSGSFQKQCSGDGTGSWHTYTVPKNTYYSFDGQGEANTLAQNDVDANGQAYANNVSEGYCTWKNDEMSQTYYKQGCGYKGEGSSYYHTLAAGTVSSTAGKAQANAAGKALMDSQGQTYINTNGYCTWRSEAASESKQRANCGDGYTGSYVTVSATEDQFSSTTSLDAANNIRNDWMQAQANLNGTCTINLPKPNVLWDFFYRDNVSGHTAWGSFYVDNNPNPSSVQLTFWYLTITGPGPKTFQQTTGMYPGVYFEIYEDTVIRINAIFYDPVSSQYSEGWEVIVGYYDAAIYP